MLLDANGLSQSTSYGLDGLKRITTITNAANATVNLTYNGLDAVTGASDFKGSTTSYARNAFGEATQEASADAGTRVTAYDGLGLPTQVVVTGLFSIGVIDEFFLSNRRQVQNRSPFACKGQFIRVE